MTQLLFISYGMLEHILRTYQTCTFAFSINWDVPVTINFMCYKVSISTKNVTVLW